MSAPNTSLSPLDHTLTFKRDERVGDYTVRSLLSTGLVGYLYDAHDGLLNRRVTLRALSPNPLLDSIVGQARALAPFPHPSLIQTYHCVEHDGQQILVGEALQGVPLQTAWRAEDDSAAERISVALSVLGSPLDALSLIHRAGWMHLNLNPNNILLSMDSRAVLLDTGLIMQNTNIDCVPKCRDWTIYDAPELRAAESSINMRADVYSAGALLAWWLLRADYFAKCAPNSVISPELVIDGLRIAEYPDSLRQVISAALQPDAKKRLASINELRNCLVSLTRIGVVSSIPARNYRVLIVDRDPDFARVVSFYVGQLMEGAQINVESELGNILAKLGIGENGVLIVDAEVPGATDLIKAWSEQDAAQTPRLILSSADPARELARVKTKPDKMRVLGRARDIKRNLRETLGSLVGEHALRHV